MLIEATRKIQSTYSRATIQANDKLEEYANRRHMNSTKTNTKDPQKQYRLGTTTAGKDLGVLVNSWIKARADWSDPTLSRSLDSRPPRGPTQYRNLASSLLPTYAASLA